MKAELLAEIPCELGESPIWLERSGELVWIDAAGCILHSLGPDGGTPTATRFPGLSPAGMAIETSRDGHPAHQQPGWPRPLRSGERRGLAVLPSGRGDAAPLLQ